MIERLEMAEEIYKGTLYAAHFDGKTEGIAEGRIEGRIEGKIEGKIEGAKTKAIDIARELLQMGMPPEQVATATKLAIKEVRKLIQ